MSQAIPSGIKSKSGNIFTRYGESVIRTKFPRRAKRLIFVSSVMGLLQQSKDPDMELVEKLNGILHVAKSPEGFLFPMYIYNFIWKNIPVNKIFIKGQWIPIGSVADLELTDEDYQTIGTYFNSHIPECLRYGSQELLTADITELLKQLKTVAHA